MGSRGGCLTTFGGGGGMGGCSGGGGFSSGCGGGGLGGRGGGRGTVMLALGTNGRAGGENGGGFLGDAFSAGEARVCDIFSSLNSAELEPATVRHLLPEREAVIPPSFAEMQAVSLRTLSSGAGHSGWPNCLFLDGLVLTSDV